MTKKELSQLYWLKKEIARDEEKLLDLETMAISTAAQLTGMPGAGNVSDKVGRYASEIADLQDVINAKLQRCREELHRLTDYIDTVEDSLMRQILTARYVEGKTWNQVADSIGGGNTENSVRKAHDRYLHSH